MIFISLLKIIQEILKKILNRLNIEVSILEKELMDAKTDFIYLSIRKN